MGAGGTGVCLPAAFAQPYPHPMTPHLRRAVAADAPALTALMHASSAYHGAYASILTGYVVTPEQVARDVMVLAEASGRVLGFYSLMLGDVPELDLMFVADEMQGSGLGRVLFQHMQREATERGLRSVKIVSNPPAEGFYLKQGAVRVGTKPPAPPRTTWEQPILLLPIGQARAGSP